MASKQVMGSGRSRSWIKSAAVLAGVVLAALQLVPGPAKTNPPVVSGRTAGASLRMNAEVSAMLRRACMDCHSHETRWPWYSRIAPLSWHIAQDVNSARKAMNLSEWSTGAGRKPSSAVGMLAAACANVKSGRMPLPRYLMLHPEARLSPRDQAMFCEWTGIEMARLLAEKRRTEKLADANGRTQRGD